MTSEQIIEMAIVYSTVGLRGAERFEFEIWRESAPEQELTVFREFVDLISELSESAAPPMEPPKSIKSNIMKRIRASQKPSSGEPKSQKPKTDVSGLQFIESDEGSWRELPVNGARIKELSSGLEVSMYLLEMDPGARLPSHHHEGVEEAFMISGDLQMSDRRIEAGDYMRAESDSRHEGLYSEGGCRALIVTSSAHYPRKAIQVYDKLNLAWRRAKHLIRAG